MQLADVVEHADGGQTVEIGAVQVEHLTDGNRRTRDAMDVPVDVFDHSLHRGDQRVHVYPAVTYYSSPPTIGCVTRFFAAMGRMDQLQPCDSPSWRSVAFLATARARLHRRV